MPSYTLRHCDRAVIAAARQRAHDAGTSLDAVLRDYLTTYARLGSPQRAGGLARAEALTADERSAIARRAAQARWGK